jgi:hypothetical protein
MSSANTLSLIPELDHPASLVADDFRTLNTADADFYWRKNFLGTYDDNFFTDILMKQILPDSR